MGCSMKKIIAFCFLITFSVVTLPASALEGNQVKYLGGTAQGIRGGVIGRLNTTSETELIFEYSGNNLAIPYDAIQSFQSSEEVARHLGVVPAILVGMFKKRQRQHFFRVEYHDSNNVAQALVFEVPKHTPRVLQAVLETRAPGAYRPCRPCANRD
jgi:hypothetical protein